jgi:hypothetical protein
LIKFAPALTSILPISFTFCVHILPPHESNPHIYVCTQNNARLPVACNRCSTSGKGSNCQLTSRNCVEYSQTGLTHIQTTGKRGSILRKGKHFSLPHLKSVKNYYKGLANCAAYLGKQEDPATETSFL